MKNGIYELYLHQNTKLDASQELENTGLDMHLVTNISVGKQFQKLVNNSFLRALMAVRINQL